MTIERLRPSFTFTEERLRELQTVVPEAFADGKINWDEFTQVINGNGPCNKQRMEHHIKYHQEGAWVREAAAAYQKRIQEFN